MRVANKSEIFNDNNVVFINPSTIYGQQQTNR